MSAKELYILTYRKFRATKGIGANIRSTPIELKAMRSWQHNFCNYDNWDPFTHKSEMRSNSSMLICFYHFSSDFLLSRVSRLK